MGVVNVEFPVGKNAPKLLGADSYWLYLQDGMGVRRVRRSACSLPAEAQAHFPARLPEIYGEGEAAGSVQDAGEEAMDARLPLMMVGAIYQITNLRRGIFKGLLLEVNHNHGLFLITEGEARSVHPDDVRRVGDQIDVSLHFSNFEICEGGAL